MKLRRAEGLNIVPFIDVMLVLLAIVLSVSTFIAQGSIPINLPQADNVEKRTNDKTIQILITADNKIFLDKTELDPITLKKAIYRIPANVLIEVKSDKDARFERFVQVLSIIKDKGHEKFSIVAQTP